MPKKPPPTLINQTASGDNNVQVSGSHNVINRISNFFQGDTEVQSALRNRRAMLELVKKTWVKGVLEKSLFKESLIELGLDELPGAVDRPWDIVLQMPDKPNRTLPGGTSIIDIFDEMNGALLILGGPGAGKTMMLLELARDTIARAEESSAEPIPVVFNLSSWSANHHSFSDWLIDELKEKYLIPEKIASPWLEGDHLLLLLDGLDEVPSDQRENCVKAINDFRQEYLIRLAICSRISDYQTLTLRLKFDGAIVIKELTSQQVDQYFEKLGINQSVVREALGDENAYHELTHSPLMLNILAGAYQDIQASEFKSLSTARDQRNYLFDVYINKMMTRRKKDAKYSLNETTSWLSWLAWNLSLHNQNVHRIEQIQPSWLPPSMWRWLYLLASRFIVVLVFISGVALITTLSSLVMYCGFFVLFILLSVSLFQKMENEIHALQVYRWEWVRAAKGALIGIVCGVILDILYSRLSYYFNPGRSGCLFCNGGCWLCWSGSIPVVGFRLFFTSSLGLSVAILGGLTSRTLDEYTGANQGIRLTLRYAANYSLLIGLIASLFIGLFVFSTRNPEMIDQIPVDQTAEKMFTGGLGIGLFAFLWFGGLGVIRHYTLRSILILMKVTPRNYAQFLDYCAERIFLRRVGGGYIFVHRLLMEHFAAMYPGSEK